MTWFIVVVQPNKQPKLKESWKRSKSPLFIFFNEEKQDKR